MSLKKTNNKLVLSAEEIIVLAGLLKYQSVFVINDSTFYDFHNDTDEMIRSIMHGFEERGLLFYSLDGELQIESRLKSVIDAVCKPDYVIVFDGMLESKKRETRYIVGLGDIAIAFQKKKTDNYVFEIQQKKDIRNHIKKILKDAGGSAIHESIDMENIALLQDQILSFQKDIAVDYLNQKLKEASSVDSIIAFLSRRGEYIRIQIHEKGPILYRNSYNSFLVNCDNRQIKITLDPDNIVHFDSVSTNEMVEEITSIIEKE